MPEHGVSELAPAPGQDPVLAHISLQCWSVLVFLASVKGTLQA